jgi:hypothetical protein
MLPALKTARPLFTLPPACDKGRSQGRSFRPLPDCGQTGLPPQPHFLDGLHRYIAVHCPHLGPVLWDDTRVSNLQCADDDATLLVCDPTHLQTLIKCAVDFCKAVGSITFRLSQGFGGGKEFQQVFVSLGSLYGTSRPAIGFPGGRPWLHLSISKPPSNA